MNAVEEIQAAIEKLTGLRDEATPAPWTRIDREIFGAGADYFTVVGDGEASYGGLIGVNAHQAILNGDLIVTLHRTIDAQLAILHAAKVDEYEWAEEWERIGKPHLRGPAKIVPINRAALELARAITGTA